MVFVEECTFYDSSLLDIDSFIINRMQWIMHVGDETTNAVLCFEKVSEFFISNIEKKALINETDFYYYYYSISV